VLWEKSLASPLRASTLDAHSTLLSLPVIETIMLLFAELWVTWNNRTPPRTFILSSPEAECAGDECSSHFFPGTGRSSELVLPSQSWGAWAGTGSIMWYWHKFFPPSLMWLVWVHVEGKSLLTISRFSRKRNSSIYFCWIWFFWEERSLGVFYYIVLLVFPPVKFLFGNP
jgi:hypothetical protein